jgi:hypothetical protein
LKKDSHLCRPLLLILSVVLRTLNETPNVKCRGSYPETELFAFPYGRHDDQIDSISQALAYEISGYDLDAFAVPLDRIKAAGLPG